MLPRIGVILELLRDMAGFIFRGVDQGLVCLGEL